MNKFYVFILALTSIFFSSQIYTTPFFTVVVPSYKNAEWYQKNLDSIFSQTYTNYRVIYVDDCSSDETGNLVEDYIKDHNLHDKVTLIKNTVRKGALANIYYAIHSCNDNEIIVTLDGDDWFAHEEVLAKLAHIYQNSNVWLTYGQYTHPWGGMGCCRPINQHIIELNAYRTQASVASHLRTFYAWLFKQIKLEDLLFEGAFFPMTWDWAMMYPMLEMSGGRFKFISEVLYIYNTDNPINDSKVDCKFQEYLGIVIQQKSRYKKLDTTVASSEQLNSNSTYSFVIIANDEAVQLQQTLNKMQNCFSGVQIYVLYHSLHEQYRELYDQSKNKFKGVSFIPYTHNINDAFKEAVLTEEEIASTDYCIVAQVDEISSVCESMQRGMKLLTKTNAFTCSVVDVAKKKTQFNQKYPHYTHLYDDTYTYQLGWDPEIKITHQYGHIFKLSYLDKPYEQIPDLITPEGELHHFLKSIYADYACLLLTKNQ